MHFEHPFRHNRIEESPQVLATYKEDTVTAPQNSTHRPAEQRVLISAPQRSNKQSGISVASASP